VQQEDQRIVEGEVLLTDGTADVAMCRVVRRLEQPLKRGKLLSVR
jgi:hypothetical protein